MIDPSTGRVKMHLLKYDFLPGYTWWTSNGEEEEDAKREGVVHDDEREGGVKNVLENENQLDREAEHKSKQLTKKHKMTMTNLASIMKLMTLFRKRSVKKDAEARRSQKLPLRSPTQTR